MFYRTYTLHNSGCNFLPFADPAPGQSSIILRMWKHAIVYTVLMYGHIQKVGVADAVLNGGQH